MIIIIGGCSLPYDLNTGKPILWSVVPDYFFRNSDPNWDFWDDPFRQNIKCPPDEHCLDLTPRIENDIFLKLKPMKGWRQIGCVHSKQLDPDTVIEQMYCEYCNKEAHQMWMIYDYGDETWTKDESVQLIACNTPHPLWNKELHMKAEKALQEKAKRRKANNN